MTVDASSLTLSGAVVLGWRLAVALGLLWIAALGVIVTAQRTDGGDARLRHSWLVIGSVLTGACIWAAGLSAIAAMGDQERLPPLGAAVAWVLTLAASAATLAAASRPLPLHRWFGGGVGALLLFAAMAVWVHEMGWKVPVWLPGAMVPAVVLAQAETIFMLRRWRGRNAPVRRIAREAVFPAVAHAMPLALLAFAAPLPLQQQPGLDMLCAALAGAMAALTTQVGYMERHLVGQRRRLGDQLKQAHLQRSPLADPLTGLLSRQGIEMALRKAGMEAEAQGQRVTLLAIGLDGFRTVNDSYGHALGDSVLREVARRLAGEARQLVSPPKIDGHHVARLGGDEFALMLHGQVDRQAIGRAAGAVLERLTGPLVCEEQEVTLAASIGIACFPEDGGASKLLSRAQAAMHAAKEAGGCTYMFFEPRMEDSLRDRHELLRDLRVAIENQQLELFYQPKIDAKSGKVTAAEALLRWHHPVRGTLSPDVFVPLAERHGLIGALGNWVIEDACRTAKVWRERGLKMRVAINLSAFQMRQNDLVERIQTALRRYGVNPQRLTCEITESVAMEDTQVTHRTFDRLGQAGIHLSIDDFGTGYSSLSYLRRLPATELKIDRSFTMDLETSEDARAIVDAVLKLAHAIGLKVVAEGVETLRQRDILLQLGCDEFQGYLFARPMSARALLLWAVDDKSAKKAFRPSLFAESDMSSAQASRAAPPSSNVQPIPLRRRGS